MSTSLPGYIADKVEAEASGDPKRILAATAWQPWMVDGPGGTRTPACKCRHCGAWDTDLDRPIDERRHDSGCPLGRLLRLV